MSNLALQISWLDKSVLSFLFSGVLTIGIFLLEAYCLFVVAKRRGLPNPWLSWIPSLQLWVLGGISDHYQANLGKKRFKRWSLLVFSLLSSLAGSFMSRMVKDVVVDFVMTGAFQWPDLEWFLSLGGLAIVAALLAIVLKILEVLALYDLFRSCQPKNALLYLLVSTFFGVITPVFMLLCYKQDLGLPKAEVE